MNDQQPPPSKTRPKQIFWLEGVTRKEILNALADRRPTRFRRQGPRRALVIFNIAVLLGLAATSLIVPVKLATYLEFALLAVAILAYFKARSSVRSVSDAPDELLDERQIQVRNAAYVVAYRLLGLAVFVTLALFLLVDSITLPLQKGLYLAGLLGMAGLPTWVLAWQLPSEPQDEDPHAPQPPMSP